jgi:hypothetical protein
MFSIHFVLLALYSCDDSSRVIVKNKRQAPLKVSD